MKKLKILNAEASDFLSLDNNILLEDLSVISNSNDIEIEKRVIKKIISMKCLKEVKLFLKKLDYNDISNINDLNTSINKIKIEWINHPNYILYNLLEKFPNLSDLELRISYNENGLNDIEITENIKSKINKLTIYCKNATIKLFCQPFQNLEKIDITIYGEFHNIKDRFPFLKNN